MMEESQNLPIFPMMYHRRFTDLNNQSRNDMRDDERQSPLQILHPNGEIGIGIPLLDTNSNAVEEEARACKNIVLVSPPSNTASSRAYLKAIIFWFTVLYTTNVIVTIFLYKYANKVDMSLVQNKYVFPIKPFQSVSNTRDFNDYTHFITTIAIISFGELSVLSKNPFGLSIFSAAIFLNFLFGITAIPYFLYAVRFLLDFVMLYLSFALRSKIILNFLPIKVYRHS